MSSTHLTKDATGARLDGGPLTEMRSELWVRTGTGASRVEESGVRHHGHQEAVDNRRWVC